MIAAGSYLWLSQAYGPLVAIAALLLFGPYATLFVLATYDELVDELARRRRGPSCLGVTPRKAVWGTVRRLERREFVPPRELPPRELSLPEGRVDGGEPDEVDPLPSLPPDMFNWPG